MSNRLYSETLHGVQNFTSRIQWVSSNSQTPHRDSSNNITIFRHVCVRTIHCGNIFGQNWDIRSWMRRILATPSLRMTGTHRGETNKAQAGMGANQHNDAGCTQITVLGATNRAMLYQRGKHLFLLILKIRHLRT